MKKKKKRGFASMNKDIHKQISQKGGKQAHKKGRAHTFTFEEAKVAGRKGGKSSARARKAREEMVFIPSRFL